jgi:hypothetical protein
MALILVYGHTAEAKNPSLNAPLRDDVGDPLAVDPRGSIMELLSTSIDAAIVGIDSHR